MNSEAKVQLEKALQKVSELADITDYKPEGGGGQNLNKVLTKTKQKIANQGIYFKIQVEKYIPMIV